MKEIRLVTAERAVAGQDEQEMRRDVNVGSRQPYCKSCYPGAPNYVVLAWSALLALLLLRKEGKESDR